MIKNIFCLILLSLCCAETIKANNDSLPQSRAEVFLNISNSLARFTGNQADNVFLDAPFLLGVKIRNNKGTSAFRLGMDFNVQNSSGINQGISTKNTDQYYVANAGIEFRKLQRQKFGFYWGGDIRYYQLTSETNTEVLDPFFGNVSTSRFFTQNNGPGIGAFMGFIWNITPRISLFTEGSLAFYALNNYREVKELNSPFKTVLEDRIVYQFSPLAPNSLFFLYKF